MTEPKLPDDIAEMVAFSRKWTEDRAREKQQLSAGALGKLAPRGGGSLLAGGAVELGRQTADIEGRVHGRESLPQDLRHADLQQGEGTGERFLQGWQTSDAERMGRLVDKHGKENVKVAPKGEGEEPGVFIRRWRPVDEERAKELQKADIPLRTNEDGEIEAFNFGVVRPQSGFLPTVGDVAQMTPDLVQGGLATLAGIGTANPAIAAAVDAGAEALRQVGAEALDTGDQRDFGSRLADVGIAGAFGGASQFGANVLAKGAQLIRPSTRLGSAIRKELLGTSATRASPTPTPDVTYVGGVPVVAEQGAKDAISSAATDAAKSIVGAVKGAGKSVYTGTRWFVESGLGKDTAGGFLQKNVPVAEQIGKAQAERMEILQALDINDATLAQKTGSQFIMDLEDAMAASTHGGPIREARRSAKLQFTKAAAKMTDVVGHGQTKSMSKAGVHLWETYTKYVQKNIDDLAKIGSREFGAIDKKIGGVEEFGYDNVLKVLSDEIKLRPVNITGQEDLIRKKLVKSIRQITDTKKMLKLRKAGSVDGKMQKMERISKRVNLQQFHNQATAIGRSIQEVKELFPEIDSPAANAIAKKLYAAINLDMDAAGVRLQKLGHHGVAEDFNRAKSFYRSQVEVIESLKTTALASVLGGIKTRMPGSLSGQGVLTGILNLEDDQIASTMELIGKFDRRAKGAIKVALLEKLTQKAGIADAAQSDIGSIVLSPAKFAKFAQDNQDKLIAILGDEGYAGLKTITSAAKSLIVPAVGSRTAVRGLMDQFMNLFTDAFTSPLDAMKGIPSFMSKRKLAIMLANPDIARTIAKAMKFPKKTAAITRGLAKAVESIKAHEQYLDGLGDFSGVPEGRDSAEAQTEGQRKNLSLKSKGL